MAPRPLLYLLDGHSLAYRHHFAYINNPLMTSAGEPTSAIFGFSRSLMDILQKDKPHYLAVTFDDGLSGRDTLYTEYKGTRDQMPDDLTAQMPGIYRLVQAFNIPILMVQGYEADDVIGTIAAQAEAQDVDVRIISGDGDILQLLSPHTSVQLRVRRKEASGRFVVRDIIYDEDAFRREYGFEPRQLVDFKALKGDTSDNIPGVAGIGDKGATNLLQQFGSLEAIYERLDEIKGATQKKLAEGRESAFLSKDLATIRRDVPVQLTLEACVAHDFDRRDVEALFLGYEFRSLADQLARVTPVQGEQLSLFGGAAGDGEAAAPADALVEPIIVDDEDALRDLVATLNSAAAITFDLESTSTDQMAADMVGIALSPDGERGYYIPVGHETGPQLPLKQVLDALRGPLTDPAIPKYAHNAKYDLVVMQRYGIDVAPITFDTMIAEWVHDPGSGALGLKNLARERLGVRMTEIKELIGTGKKAITMAAVAIERAAPYAAADAVFTHQLVGKLQPELEADSLVDLFETIEMPLVPVLAAMERTGVLLDTEFLAQMSEQLREQLAAVEDEIYAAGGVGPFNINSPKQLNDVLFRMLGLKAEGVRKTTHGYSTAVDVLENLRGEHPIIELILRYRELHKLKSTYVDALPALINPLTGRVHTSFNQTGSSTGRLSSSNPNLQNIPIRTEMGREIRRAFVTPPGTSLLSVDYSQVELRILAHIADEPTLLEAFQQGQDIHAATASVVYGIPLDRVTKEQRIFAKRVNFGVLYGMGAFRLARDSNLTLAEARSFIDTYFSRLPKVQEYIENTKQMAREQGYVQTLFGRKRRFPQLHRVAKGNANVIQQAEREAINMPIQGTAADIIKQAMNQLARELNARRLGARMLLQVHDELVFEVPDRELQETAALVVERMEHVIELKAPLRANAQCGENWLDMQPV